MLGISISTNAEYNFEVPPGLLEKIQLLETIRSVCRECVINNDNRAAGQHLLSVKIVPWLSWMVSRVLVEVGQSFGRHGY